MIFAIFSGTFPQDLHRKTTLGRARSVTANYTENTICILSTGTTESVASGVGTALSNCKIEYSLLEKTARLELFLKEAFRQPEYLSGRAKVTQPVEDRHSPNTVKDYFP